MALKIDGSARKVNWFIALSVAPDAWYHTKIQAPPPHYRLTHPQDLHLTLVFLGEVDEPTALAAWDVFEWPLKAWPVTLGKVFPLGPPNAWTALVVGIDENASVLGHAIATSRGPSSKKARVTLDERPPRPHITLARAPEGADPAAREAGLAWAARQALQGEPLVLNRLALYTAELDGPARYRIVRERRL